MSRPVSAQLAVARDAVPERELERGRAELAGAGEGEPHRQLVGVAEHRLVGEGAGHLDLDTGGGLEGGVEAVDPVAPAGPNRAVEEVVDCTRQDHVDLDAEGERGLDDQRVGAARERPVDRADRVRGEDLGDLLGQLGFRPAREHVTRVVGDGRHRQGVEHGVGRPDQIADHSELAHGRRAHGPVGPGRRGGAQRGGGVVGAAEDQQRFGPADEVPVVGVVGARIE